LPVVRRQVSPTPPRPRRRRRFNLPSIAILSLLNNWHLSDFRDTNGLQSGIWALGLLFSATPLRAQVAGATLSGTITDSQGGAVVGAKVATKNGATGVTTESTTNASGAYSIVNLLPADYEVSVTAFKVSFRMSPLRSVCPLALRSLPEIRNTTTATPSSACMCRTIGKCVPT
jgi:Carboxypeptidase regulatory-like domain